MKTALALDFGTTKVAAVIADEERNLLDCASSPHRAGISLPNGGEEEETGKIIQCAAEQIRALSAGLRKNVSAIGITGQMHSVLLKKDGEVSDLVTWQDHRCGETMLRDFRRKSGRILREGFGGTTLARLAAEGKLPADGSAATIADYAGALLCADSHIVTDPTHAASWGLYEPQKNCWDRAALKALGIPERIMPEIAPCGSVIGKLSAAAAEKFGLPNGIPVINAVGDNQASILGTGKEFSEELFLTIGTGAQLSAVVETCPETVSENLEIRPFPGGRWLLVSAPLCGGSAFAFLADAVNRFRCDLGEKPMARGALLDHLDELALAVLRTGSGELTAEPHFSGERYAPGLRGSIAGLTLNNASPGQLGAALATGIVRNLKRGFPGELLGKRRRIIGSGNAVRLLKSIQLAIENEFKLELLLPDFREEAAVGAAALALSAMEKF